MGYGSSAILNKTSRPYFTHKSRGVSDIDVGLGNLRLKKHCFKTALHVCSGFLEKEIKKDGIPMLDTGDVPDAPAPREMIDLEVIQYVVCYFQLCNINAMSKSYKQMQLIVWRS